jgi:glycosyltransferase involved in cell wall biosynthesis
MCVSKTVVLPVMIWRRVGGLEAVVMDIASTFTALGWQVKVFSVFDDEPPEQVPGIEAVSLSPQFRWPRALWHGRQSRWPRAIWRRYLWQPLLARRVRKALAGGGLLIFGHAQLLPLLDILPPLPGVHRGAWVYGNDAWGGEARRWASRLTRRGRIVSVSTFTADQLVRAGVTKPIDVVPPLVDTLQFTPTSTPERIRRSEILICGRMAAWERYKGHDLLLECLTIAESLAGRDLTLRIVGTGDDLDRLRAKARQLGLERKVIFTGRLSFQELVEAYRHCGVFCMPSCVEQREQRYWTGEGFGIVYIEAAACGRPVIASTDGGAPETILPGETGLLADPRSPESVARAIADILGDPARADAMGRRGREMVEQRFSREVFLENLRELLMRDLPAV